MAHHDFAELVWENGRILTRNLQNRTEKSVSCMNHPSNLFKAKAETEKSMSSHSTQKIWTENPMLAYSPLSAKRNHDHQRQKLLPEYYQNDTNMFFEHITNNNDEAIYIIPSDSHIVPVYKPHTLRSSSRSKIITQNQSLDSMPRFPISSTCPGFQSNPNNTINESERGSRKPNDSLSDEQSAAVGHKVVLTSKRLAAEQVHGKSSPQCSCMASNHPVYTMTRNDLDEADDPNEDGRKEALRSAGVKRSRSARVHSLSERRRRGKINRKMRALQELIPNCDKVDKAAMLEEAIEYMKTLQLQLQVLSMGGAGLCMPPMVIPNGLQQLQAMQLPHYFHMATPISTSTALPAGTSRMRHGVLGFAGQAPSMVSPYAPFFHYFGGSTIPSVPVLGVPGEASSNIASNMNNHLPSKRTRKS